eukprot:CAMPEP_0117751802 /NCGR_PEP_ID=MMETSP0947-20121206/11205_1 /TAXON_ID=44440 /ORGANISM="Chattonella subsalsa, Strain CCMP2191" /LENGTH=378 /DNA_ID=CAMNT_0005570279 /DNA_START=252 /DNA_END=1388 /DNA_ORIENTATION=-
MLENYQPTNPAGAIPTNHNPSLVYDQHLNKTEIGTQQVPLIYSHHVKNVSLCREKGIHWTSEMKGRWFDEEILYFEIIYELFQDGILAYIEPGTTFREFAAELLQCDTMRISKKFTGDMRIGHLRFPRQARRILTLLEQQALQLRLDEREARFMSKRAIIRPRKRSRNEVENSNPLVSKPFPRSVHPWPRKLPQPKHDAFDSTKTTPTSMGMYPNLHDLSNEEEITSRVLLELRVNRVGTEKYPVKQEEYSASTDENEINSPNSNKCSSSQFPANFPSPMAPPTAPFDSPSLIPSRNESTSLGPISSDIRTEMPSVESDMFEKIRDAIYEGFSLEPGPNFLSYMDSLAEEVLNDTVTIDGAIQKVRDKFKTCGDRIVF